MKHSDVLKEALAKFGSEGQHWTHGAIARDQNLHRTQACSSKARCWCSIGAIKAVLGPNVAIPRTVDFLRRAAPGNAIVHFNDKPGRTFTEVKELFVKAIEIAEAEESKEAAA